MPRHPKPPRTLGAPTAEAAEPFFVPVEEAARLYGCGRTTIYERYIDTGLLHPVRHGKRTVIALAELRALATQLATEAGIALEAAQ